MKLTNNFNLPAPVVTALSRDAYSKGESHRSVTQLIDSPQISILRRQYDSRLTEDVSKRLWSVLGTAVHQMFETAVSPQDQAHMISEERYYYKHPDGWTLSGAIDLTQIDHHNKSIALIDYKCTSVWSVIFEKSEWHNQLNAYAWLLRKCEAIGSGDTNYVVNKLQIIAVLRDWKENDLKRTGGNYPEAPIVVIDIPVWTDEKQDEYMEGRIKLHSDAEYAFLTGQTLPPCSEKEQWAKAAKYAVHKGSAKRATRVFDSELEAHDFVRMKGDNLALRVIHRPGEKIRCSANWCSVNEWCEQYRKECE
jgi:hypothetical protein